MLDVRIGLSGDIVEHAFGNARLGTWAASRQAGAFEEFRGRYLSIAGAAVECLYGKPLWLPLMITGGSFWLVTHVTAVYKVGGRDEVGDWFISVPPAVIFPRATQGWRQCGRFVRQFFLGYYASGMSGKGDMDPNPVCHTSGLGRHAEAPLRPVLFGECTFSLDPPLAAHPVDSSPLPARDRSRRIRYSPIASVAVLAMGRIWQVCPICREISSAIAPNERTPDKCRFYPPFLPPLSQRYYALSNTPHPPRCQDVSWCLRRAREK